MWLATNRCSLKIITQPRTAESISGSGIQRAVQSAQTMEAGTMEEAGANENGRNERPKSQGAGNFEHLGNASGSARGQRAHLWPREARGSGIFSQRHTLRHDGKSYRLEIRSRKGKGCWIMVAGRLVVHRATRLIALANVVKALDPEVEEVRDESGRVLA